MEKRRKKHIIIIIIIIIDRIELSVPEAEGENGKERGWMDGRTISSTHTWFSFQFNSFFSCSSDRSPEKKFYILVIVNFRMDMVLYICIGSCRETSEVSADQLRPLLSVEFSIKYQAAFFFLFFFFIFYFYFFPLLACLAFLFFQVTITIIAEPK